MRFFLHYLLCLVFLFGCHSVQKKEVDRFPLEMMLQSFNVVNHIPARSGRSLDYLLNLDQWAQSKVVPKGFSGVGVLSLIEGFVDLTDDPQQGKILSVNIVVGFEIKNDPQYGYSKTYFRVSQKEKVLEKDMPHIEKYLKKCLQHLDDQFYREITSCYPMILIKKKPVSNDTKPDSEKSKQ
ncbi:MAG: hypothetical protein H6925_05490 [Holosporaceae bacterium]|nr:MAG: hypothetical protein H6925_05490 [Holosporaceae bacterium]